MKKSDSFDREIDSRVKHWECGVIDMPSACREADVDIINQAIDALIDDNLNQVVIVLSETKRCR